MIILLPIPYNLHAMIGVSHPNTVGASLKMFCDQNISLRFSRAWNANQRNREQAIWVIVLAVTITVANQIFKYFQHRCRVSFLSGGAQTSEWWLTWYLHNISIRGKENKNLIKNLSVLPLEGKFFGHTGLDRLITQICRLSWEKFSYFSET